MKLLTPPWKTAWYDDQLSERFFHEMSRFEINSVKEIETSAQWMEQLIIEFGQLAQNMIQLEKSSPPHQQIRQSFEKALKLSVMAAHLTASLDRADPEKEHTHVENNPGNYIKVPQRIKEMALNVSGRTELTDRGTSSANKQPQVAPPRQTIMSLSRKGLSTAEIEIITGQSRTSVENVLTNHK